MALPKDFIMVFDYEHDRMHTIEALNLEPGMRLFAAYYHTSTDGELHCTHGNVTIQSVTDDNDMGAVEIVLDGFEEFSLVVYYDSFVELANEHHNDLVKGG